MVSHARTVHYWRREYAMPCVMERSCMPSAGTQAILLNFDYVFNFLFHEKQAHRILIHYTAFICYFKVIGHKCNLKSIMYY